MTFTYSWLRCPPGATAADSTCTTVGSGVSYTVAAADVGHPLAVSVTAGSVGGISAPAMSPLTAPVQGRPLTSTVAPSIGGAPQIPNPLSANPGTWSVPPTSVSYSWYRCDADGTSNCTQVAGNSAQYTLSAPDQDHTIALQVDVTSPGRSATAKSPALTVQDQALPQPRVLPTVAGTAVRTNRLRGLPKGPGRQARPCATSGSAATAPVRHARTSPVPPASATCSSSPTKGTQSC